MKLSEHSEKDKSTEDWVQPHDNEHFAQYHNTYILYELVFTWTCTFDYVLFTMEVLYATHTAVVLIENTYVPQNTAQYLKYSMLDMFMWKLQVRPKSLSLSNQRL